MQNEKKLVFLLCSFTIIRNVLPFMIRKANYSDIAPIVEYLKSVPFDVSRTQLYSAQELYGDFTPGEPGQLDNCLDTQVYRHYLSTGKQTNDIKESMAHTLHDHGVYVALGEFFRSHNYLKCIGIMGGHAMLRTDSKFRQIVFLTKQLTEQGFCMLSGGGPGAMEATHLGAWMAGRIDTICHAYSQIL